MSPSDPGKLRSAERPLVCLPRQVAGARDHLSFSLSLSLGLRNAVVRGIRHSYSIVAGVIILMVSPLLLLLLQLSAESNRSPINHSLLVTAQFTQSFSYGTSGVVKKTVTAF